MRGIAEIKKVLVIRLVLVSGGHENLGEVG